MIRTNERQFIIGRKLQLTPVSCLDGNLIETIFGSFKANLRKKWFLVRKIDKDFIVSEVL
jgi:hypothetical protein